MILKHIFICFCLLFFGIGQFVWAQVEEVPKIEIPNNVSYIVGNDEQAALFILSSFLSGDFMFFLERDFKERNKLVLENSDSLVVFPQKKALLERKWEGYIDYPHIRLLPDHPLYFYVQWKERRSVSAVATNKNRIELHLLYAAKRLVELEQSLKKDFSEEVIKSILEGHQYHIESLFNSLKQGWKESKEDTAQNILKTEVYILNFEKKIRLVQKKNELVNEASGILFVYQKILEWIGTERGDPQRIVYEYDLPQKGNYTLLIEKENFEGSFESDPYEDGVVVASEKITPTGDFNNEWLVFNPVFLSEGKSKLTLTLPPFINLVSGGSFEATGESSDAVDGQKSKRLNTGKERKMELAIEHYNPYLSYDISFYYRNLMGSKLDFVVLGEDVFTEEAIEVVRETLPQTKCWNKFLYRLGPNPNLKSPKIVLEYPSEVVAESASLLDNLVVNIKWEPKPILVLTENKEIGSVFSSKKEKIDLDFDKLDLFEYQVTLDNSSQEPFFLVFNQTFHPKQQLYPGLFCEDRNFWCRVFGSWRRKPLAEQFHFEANGFANGWFIDPKIVHENKFTIEFWYQRIYYPGLGVITVIFLAGIAVFARERLKELS